MTRIAFISDIHGNAYALETVLEDIQHNAVDKIVCLGDVATLGPTPNRAVELVRELDCLCILGNHDEFLLEPALIHDYAPAPVVVEGVDWCREQLSAENLNFLTTFQRTACLRLNDDTTLFCYHGSPHSHMDNLLATTPTAEVDQLLAPYSADVMLGGHTHVQMLRQHRGSLLVNPGSVGIPFHAPANGKEPKLLDHAEYAVVESQAGTVTVELKQVPLRRESLYEAAAQTSSPVQSWLMSEYQPH